ncbi:hypothetical protein SAMN05444158_4832 [Bradyrhizobium canariense]|uniref:Uncharacterized protein n=1 Tax=Bradyrhizobium canariense TaxID=255045 RepID=A0A1H1YIT6_9BRAD|nr:hypothetical protein SAMN05444158_4832 [Bradyrhizobium canariense]
MPPCEVGRVSKETPRPVRTPDGAKYKRNRNATRVALGRANDKTVSLHGAYG